MSRLGLRGLRGLRPVVAGQLRSRPQTGFAEARGEALTRASESLRAPAEISARDPAPRAPRRCDKDPLGCK